MRVSAQLPNVSTEPRPPVVPDARRTDNGLSYEERFGSAPASDWSECGVVSMIGGLIIQTIIVGSAGASWASPLFVFSPLIISFVGGSALVLSGLAARYGCPPRTVAGLSAWERVRRAFLLFGQSSYRFLTGRGTFLTIIWAVTMLLSAFAVVGASVSLNVSYNDMKVTAVDAPLLSVNRMTDVVAAQQEKLYRRQGRYSPMVPALAEQLSATALTAAQELPRLTTLARGQTWVMNYRGRLVVHRHGQLPPGRDSSQRGQLQ